MGWRVHLWAVAHRGGGTVATIGRAREELQQRFGGFIIAGEKSLLYVLHPNRGPCMLERDIVEAIKRRVWSAAAARVHAAACM